MPDSETDTRAIRLSVAYEGDAFSLLSRQDIEMTLMPSEAESGEGAHAADGVGMRVDVVDEGGRVLYRLANRSFIPESVEAPTGDDDGTLTRRAFAPARGSFDVVVPFNEWAHELVLYRAPRLDLLRSGEAEPVQREVFRVSLKSSERERQ